MTLARHYDPMCCQSLQSGRALHSSPGLQASGGFWNEAELVQHWGHHAIKQTLVITCTCSTRMPLELDQVPNKKTSVITGYMHASPLAYRQPAQRHSCAFCRSGVTIGYALPLLVLVALQETLRACPAEEADEAYEVELASHHQVEEKWFPELRLPHRNHWQVPWGHQIRLSWWNSSGYRVSQMSHSP